jgi:integrase
LQFIATKRNLKSVTRRKSKDSPKGPFRIVTAGSASVKIYRSSHAHVRTGKKYEQFTLVYFEGATAAGRPLRKRRFFSDSRRAKAEAEVIASRLNRGHHELVKLGASDAESYVRAKEALKPLGIQLHEAVNEFVHAVTVLNGRSLREVAEEVGARTRAAVTQRQAVSVVDDLLAARKREGVSTRYIQSLRSHLTRFKTAFVREIGRITAADMEQWLTAIGGGPRTRNNFRASLVTLFHFARKKGYLPKSIATEADELALSVVPTSVANIYAAEDLQKLLAVADERVLPAIAIGAFTGLRSASLARLRWENVKWEQGIVEIPAAIAKNGKRYFVPLLPCLSAWLAPYRSKKGKVITGVRLEPALRATYAAAGVKRLHNGLRDSFISYRVAQTMNLPQVAFEAGNSVEMIRSKYLEARTKPEAEAWFAVMPTAPANVVAMEAAR